MKALKYNESTTAATAKVLISMILNAVHRNYPSLCCFHTLIFPSGTCRWLHSTTVGYLVCKVLTDGIPGCQGKTWFSQAREASHGEEEVHCKFQIESSRHLHHVLSWQAQLYEAEQENDRLRKHVAELQRQKAKLKHLNALDSALQTQVSDDAFLHPYVSCT